MLQLTHGEFVVLGPHDSTTLTAMVREIGLLNPETQHSQPLTIINFAATADDEKIIRRAGLDVAAKADKADSIRNTFAAAGIQYYRTIASDSVLADALVRELERRGVEPGHRVQGRAEDETKTVEVYPDHIALISELDSVYGQTLPEIMATAFDDYAAKHGATPLAHPASFVTFSYIRGLDGRTPRITRLER